MRTGGIAGLVVLCSAGWAAATETPDAGADSLAPDGPDAAAATGETPEVPGRPAPPPIPPMVAPPPPAPAPVPVSDPRRAALGAARRAQAAWPLAYVDRPQTMFKGMEDFSVTARDYFGGPANYHRFATGVSYAKGVTDQLELALAFPSLYCTGRGVGACRASLKPDLSLRAAMVEGARARLDLGVLFANFTDGAELWSRLKLVWPHRFSLEIEPLVWVGLAERQIVAWWSPLAVQDGNQSRVILTFDANLQATEHLLLWASVIPYLPVARLADPSDAAVEVVAGVSVAVTKHLDVGASCWSLDVRAARTWEYVPDVRACALTLLTRGFGFPPEVSVSTGPVPLDFY
jgi:hypothetical protein